MERRPAFSPPIARAFLLTVLLVLAAALLAGCDLPLGAPETTAPTAEPELTATPDATPEYPPGVTSVVFWEPYTLDRPQGLLLGEMVRDFEAENPDIAVEIVPKSGYVGIHGAMLAGIEQGGEAGSDLLPDLSVAFPSMIAEYAEAGVVAPLDGYLFDPEVGFSDEDWADIYTGTLEAGRLPGFGGQLLAFPFVHNAVGMWVNQTLLQQAGWEHAPVTWEEFEQACYDIRDATGKQCYPFIESVSTFNAWLYSRGGRQLDESGRRAVFNDLAGVESLALVRRLMDAGLAWRPEGPYGDYTAFTEGQAAFTFSSTGNGPLYWEAYQAALQRGIEPFAWRQALIPQIDPSHPATVSYGASFFILKGEPEQEAASWRLIRWFSDRDQSARWASSLETMPLRISALTVMTDTLETYPFFQTQVEQILPYARPEPAVAAELDIRDILYTAIISVTQYGADPQVVLDQAAREANEVLSRP